MATRAIICAKLPDLTTVKYSSLYNQHDSYFMISCNSDGYPSHMLQTLNDYYGSKDQVRQLIFGGNIKTLYRKYEPNPKGYHYKDDHQPEVTVVYARDYPIEDIDKYCYNIIKLDDRHNVYKYVDYIYKYENGKWYWSSNLSNNLSFSDVFLES